MPTLREYGWDTSTSPYGVDTGVPSTFNPTPYTWSYPGGFRTFAYTINDELGTDGRFRNCQNVSETNEFYADTVLTSFPRAERGNLHCGPSGFAWEDFMMSAVLALRVAPDVDMNAMASEACAYMLPRVNQGSSLINFIIELKDLPHMNPVRALQRVFSKRPHLRRLSLSAGSRNRFMKELVQRLTGAHLNASFGIVPFVRDIVSAYDELAWLSIRLRNLKQYAGQRQVRHYKRVLPASAGVPETKDWLETSGLSHGAYQSVPWGHDSIAYDWLGGGTRPIRLVKGRARWNLRPVYHATMRYTYTLPSMSEAEEKLAVHLDALGVRLDPAIVWNAIPFSFLVDWVVDVSGFLQSFARDNFPIKTTITDFCHSLAYRGEYELRLWYENQTLQNYTTLWNRYAGVFDSPIFRGTRSYYSRVRHEPDIHAATTRGLKLRQAALGGSLLLNKATGGKSRPFMR